MRIKFYIIILLLFTPVLLSANTGDDSVSVKKDSVFVLQPEVLSPLFLDETPDMLLDGMLPSAVSNDSTQRNIDLARAILEKVRTTQNYITSIDEASKVELPVGLSKTIGVITYEIAIHAIRLKPAYAELDVFMQFQPPQNATPLTFMARSIKFSSKGGIIGDAKLELLGDYGINFNADKVQIILRGNTSGQGTYAVMDCDGFKELALDAQVKFSRDLIRPENPDGTLGAGNVTTNFGVVLNNWNDLVVQLDIPTFQMNGLNGVGFSVRDAVFDFSDVRNATAIVFPEGYESTQFLPGNQNLWRGFYMRQLTVSLPPEFKSKGSTTRTVFLAENVLIDNMGITGKFTGNQLITLDQGDMNGWSFSLEQLSIELRANQLVEAGFKGGIVIPVGNEEKPFEYAAIINTGGNYVFNVSPAEDMEFPLWGAGNVEIYEASYLDITVENGKFLPKANLHGKMQINAKLSEGGQGIELADISFENLQIQTVKPYLKVGAFSFGSEAMQQKMAGFPISIEDIGLRNVADNQTGLDFRLKLNLVGEDAGAFAADAGLTIIGQLDDSEGVQRWRYKDVSVKDIAVDIDGGAFKINGKLIFYKNDQHYGDGFNGSVKAEFTPGLKVTATAIFGNVSGMRYWYADAMANFSSGIPVFTGVGIYGFGGGAYFAMKMDNKGIGSELGRTASGVVYVPDEKSGLGLKAIVSLGSHPKPEAFNADVTFEISFFKGGGVRHIAFGGNGYLVTPGLDVNLDKMKGQVAKLTSVVKDLESKVSSSTMGLVKADNNGDSFKQIFGEIGAKAGQKGQISARVMIDYDFENKVLHGNFEVFINVAGGIIKGIGDNNRAGWAVLHFAPKEWYVYVGTPDDRVGISVGIGPLRADATSYFMVGTKILGSPPPPPEVARILRMEPGELDYMSDLNAIGTGAGFAFGAALSVSTGNLKFLMFYARFDAGAGFDIMLKDYGDTKCAGNSDRIGINGWYANGQAYAYFEGKVGISVRVFGSRRKVDILKIGAAAVLQAKLPNPFWMRGIVGGHFSVLGGLVRGNCRFQVTIGKECEIQVDPNAILDDINVIAELTPANGETEVNVFNTPQAVFNMQVDKSFEMIDEVNGNVKRTFRIKLDHFKVLNANKELVGTLDWNANHDVLAFNSYDILPSKKELKLDVQVSFEEIKNGNWLPVTSEGKKIVEGMQQSFTTALAPDYIPYNNIEYSYPIIGQLNFYKDEAQAGYIKLKKAMPDLLNPGAEWRQEGRFTAEDKSQSTFGIDYSYSTNMITYEIPGDLQTNKIYTLELVNVPVQQNKQIDRNVSEVTNKITIEGQELETEIATKKAEGTIDNLQEKSIYTSYCRTSMYPTFGSKIDAFNFQDGWTIFVGVGIRQLILTLPGTEHFEKQELHRIVGRQNSLVAIEADASNFWYKNLVYPLVYADYPIGGTLQLTRPRGTLDTPPLNALFLRQPDSEDLTLTDEKVFSGWQVPWPEHSALVFDLPLEMAKDYTNLRDEAANRSVSGNFTQLQRLLNEPFPVLRTGRYKVNFSYVLPGINKVSSQKEITINYPPPTEVSE